MKKIEFVGMSHNLTPLLAPAKQLPGQGHESALKLASLSALSSRVMKRVNTRTAMQLFRNVANLETTTKVVGLLSPKTTRLLTDF